MTDSHAKLFEPFTLNNGVTLQSRLVIAPLTLYCQNPDGTVSEAAVSYTHLTLPTKRIV